MKPTFITPLNKAPFAREERYYVLKISDMRKYLSAEKQEAVRAIAEKLNAGRTVDGKTVLQAVVVEHDWPEYERVWQMIETRVATTRRNFLNCNNDRRFWPISIPEPKPWISLSDAHVDDIYAESYASRKHLVQRIEAKLRELNEAPEQEPLFWYRPVGNDGGYEGPIHNASIEQVRKNSRAWKPLYTTQRQRDPLTNFDKFNGVDIQFRRSGTDWPKPYRVSIMSNKNEREDHRTTAFCNTLNEAIEVARGSKGEHTSPTQFQLLTLDEINKWLDLRIKACGPNGVTDLRVFAEECVRYGELSAYGLKGGTS